MLSRISSTITSTMDFPYFLETTLDQLMQTMNVPIGLLYLSDQVVTRGISMDRETAMNLGVHIDEARLTTTISVGDWNTEDVSFADLKTLMNKLEMREMRASVISPIMVDDKRVGYLCISSTEPREWTQQEIWMVDTSSEHISTTTKRIQITTSAMGLSNLVKRLKQISGTFNQLFTFNEAIKSIGKGFINLLEADHAAIFLRNPDDSISMTWVFELSETQIDQVVFKASKEMAGLLLASTEPMIMPDIMTSDMPSLLKEYLSSEEVVSASLLPLVFSNKVVGIIAGFHDTTLDTLPLEREILMSFSNMSAITLQTAQMFDRLESGYTEIALALAQTVDDRETKETGTSIQVANWSEEIARSLGCSEEELKDIRWAALLHNIGKTEIPDPVLRKPGPLSEREWNIVQKHPLKGAEMIQPLPRFKNVGTIIRCSRERYDGKGYPEKLFGTEIPLGARVLAVADAYGSMVDERPYRKARSQKDAISELQQQSGEQFDPLVVKTFLRMINTEGDVN